MDRNALLVIEVSFSPQAPWSGSTAIARPATLTVGPAVSARPPLPGGRDGGERLPLRQAGVPVAGGVRRFAVDLGKAAAKQPALARETG